MAETENFVTENLIPSSLEGRLRNTHLRKTDAMVPLFEAVVNSIQALEDFPAVNDFEPTIKIVVRRIPQPKLGFEEDKTGRAPQEKITGFEIIDNGVGFDDSNFKSFKTLDSGHKYSKGCKGIGRLAWLKAFEYVDVTSTFKDSSGVLKTRCFKCDGRRWVYDESLVDAEVGAKCETSVSLCKFKDPFVEYMPKIGETIAERILEHCLWYYLRDTPPPRIILIDGDRIIDFDSSFDLRRNTSTKRESLMINGCEFTLSHIKLIAEQKPIPRLGLCANGRLVREIGLAGKVPGLFGKLKQDDGEFTYVCYVSSPILDQAVTNERTDFTFSDHGETDSLFGDVSLNNIIDAVVKRSADYLASELSAVKEASSKRVAEYVNYVAPRYRPLLKRFPEISAKINPDIKDAELDVQLHKELMSFETKVVEDGHKILEAKADEPFEGYKERVEEYLKDVSDIKKSDLANYVTHRKTVLKFLAKCLKRKPDGTYVDEEVIHKLIMPMIETGDGLSLEDANLWIVDERLAFCDYIASDKPIKTIPGDQSGSRLEPDIVQFATYDKAVMVADGDRKSSSITIVELKKPMRDDYTDGPKGNPVDQVLTYLNLIRDNKQRAADGRPLDGRMEIPAFCYVICDVTPKLKTICSNRSFRKTIDGQGYYCYNGEYNAYIEVIPFDKLLRVAEERNKAFFERLGLPEN